MSNVQSLKQEILSLDARSRSSPRCPGEVLASGFSRTCGVRLGFTGRTNVDAVAPPRRVETRADNLWGCKPVKVVSLALITVYGTVWVQRLTE